MKNHLYESIDKTLHACEGENIPDVTGPLCNKIDDK